MKGSVEHLMSKSAFTEHELSEIRAIQAIHAVGANNTCLQGEMT